MVLLVLYIWTVKYLTDYGRFCTYYFDSLNNWVCTLDILTLKNIAKIYRYGVIKPKNIVFVVGVSTSMESQVTVDFIKVLIIRVINFNYAVLIT